MKKIKKAFLYILGSFLAFAFNQTKTFAAIAPVDMMQTAYGPPPTSMPKTLISILFSPVAIIIALILALVIGTIIFIKRKRKNAKEDS